MARYGRIDTGTGKPARTPQSDSQKRTLGPRKPTGGLVCNQVRKAYADCVPQEKWLKGKGYTEDSRNLNFITSASVPARDLYDVVKYIGQYNDFVPKKAAGKIAKIDPEARVWVGREGSVVLYIKPSSEAVVWPLYEAFEGIDGEVGYVDSAPSRGSGVDPEEYVLGVTNILRVWWD